MMREVRHLIASGGSGRILLARADPETKAPPEVAKLLPNANITDVSILRSPFQRWLNRGRVRHLCAIIAGPLLGVARAEMPLLIGTERLLALRRRIIAFVVTLAVMLAIGASLQYGITKARAEKAATVLLRDAQSNANFIRYEAAEFRTTARREAAVGYSRLANQTWVSGDSDRAILLLTQAYETAPDNDPLKPSYGVRLLQMARQLPNDIAALPPGIHSMVLDMDRDRLLAISREGAFVWNVADAKGTRPATVGGGTLIADGGFTKDGRSFHGLFTNAPGNREVTIDTQSGQMRDGPIPLDILDRSASGPLVTDVLFSPVRPELDSRTRQQFPVTGKLYAAVMTDDGRYVALVSGNAESGGLSLCVRDVKQGTEREWKLAIPPATKWMFFGVSFKGDQKEIDAEIADISPDGNLVLLRWFLPGSDSPTELLEVVSKKDGSSRLLKRPGRVEGLLDPGRRESRPNSWGVVPKARFSADGSLVWATTSRGNDRVVESWSTVTGMPTGFARLLWRKHDVEAVVSNRHGFKSVYNATRARVDLRPSRYATVDPKTDGDPSSAAFSGDGRRMVVGTATSPIKHSRLAVWEIAQHRPSCQVDAPAGLAGAQALWVGGNYFVWFELQRVVLFDASNCRIVDTFELPNVVKLERAALESADSAIFVGKRSVVIRRFGAIRKTVVFPVPEAWEISLSADGRILALVRADQMKFFRVSELGKSAKEPAFTLSLRPSEGEDSPLLWLLQLMRQSVVTVSDHAVSFKLAGANIDVRAENGIMELRDSERGLPLVLPPGRPENVAFSKDAWLVAFATSDQDLRTTVSVYDLRTGTDLGISIGLRGIVKDLCFNADDSEVLSVWDDGAVRRHFVMAPWKFPSWLNSLGAILSGRKLMAGEAVPLNPVEHRRLRRELTERLRQAAQHDENAAYVLEHLDPTAVLVR